MTSKRWTIVCLTLILLIAGCCDTQVAWDERPAQPGTVSAAAAWSIPAAFESKPAPTPALDLPGEILAATTDNDETLTNLPIR